MALKQIIKGSEARIIVYLSNVERAYSYTTMISMKLQMDYGYCLRILKGMLNKDWIIGTRRLGKTFYYVNEDKKIEDNYLLASAKVLMNDECAVEDN